MYRRILVPARDPSEVEPMIRFASTLLDADGEIRMLHVIPTTTLPELTRQWRASVNLVIPAHETGAALDVRVDPEVRAGADVAGVILDSAEMHGIEAILMTLGGNPKERRPFFGHVTSALLHHAPCDVVVINRLALLEAELPRILVPTFATAAPPKMLRVAEALAVRHHGIPIVTLEIGERGRGARGAVPSRSPRGIPIQHVRSFFSRALLGHRHELADMILQEAARQRYGLLLVGEDATHPEGPLMTRRFLEELFRAAPCPVMAVRG
jgi:nucleotide-binding universal stress UspA family protein